VKKETPKPREDAFIWIFCGRAGHLDEFCFRLKRIAKRRHEYARNSYHDEFFDLPPRSYSHVLSHSFDGILLGYTPHGRSYRFYDLETNTVVESCDVTFNEIAIVLVVPLSVQVTRK
jgi:hypothetical protein